MTRTEFLIARMESISISFIRIETGNEYWVLHTLSSRKRRISKDKWEDMPDSVIYKNKLNQVFEDTLESFLTRFKLKN